MENIHTSEEYQVLFILVFKALLENRQREVPDSTVPKLEMISAMYTMSIALAETRPYDKEIILEASKIVSRGLANAKE